MKITLIDKSSKMVSSWSDFFKEEESVQIVHGDITKIRCDAIVSPANSFGFMDGGVDYAISERLGWEIQNILQNKISNLPEGELLIGNALIIETLDKDIPFLISAPTMRVPMNFNIATSINPYLAMKATLINAKLHDEINHIGIPGFCTGVGKMQEQISARQMYIAYEEVMKNKKLNFKNFAEAQKYHWNINPQGKINE